MPWSAVLQVQYQLYVHGHRNDGGPVVGAAVRDPLPANWIVEWARFFDGLGDTPNYSLKLAMHAQLALDYNGISNRSPPTHPTSDRARLAEFRQRPHVAP